MTDENTGRTILVVDDEETILRMLRVVLEADGFQVVTATTGEEAVQLAETSPPDLVLLDILMPGLGGFAVLKRLRETNDAPIIFVTAKDADKERVRGLEAGADDYIVKPFNPDEVLARVRAVLRRSATGRADEEPLQVGDLEIDERRQTATRDGTVLHLTQSEWILLRQLMAHPGRIIFNSELLTRAWGPEYRDDDQYLRVWISRLRRKLEKDPANPTLIRTAGGMGYIFHRDSEESSASTNE